MNDVEARLPPLGAEDGVLADGRVVSGRDALELGQFGVVLLLGVPLVGRGLGRARLQRQLELGLVLQAQADCTLVSREKGKKYTGK